MIVNSFLKFCLWTISRDVHSVFTITSTAGPGRADSGYTVLLTEVPYTKETHGKVLENVKIT